MSFTTRIKNEISNNYNNLTTNRMELSAILRNSYHDGKLEIITENSTVCKHIYTLFKEIYNINVETSYQNTKFSKNRLYHIIVFDKLDLILKDLEVVDDNNKYKETPSNYFLEAEDEKRAYLKGIFLIAGSINDPKTSMYHLEFSIDTLQEAEYVSNLLNDFYLNSKIIKREKGYMVYLKEAEKIGDFLRIINANNAVMYYEDIRIYRDHKNMTNRLNNCEQANFEKSIKSAEKQIEDINLILEKIGKDALDEKLEMVINYRLKYSEVSMKELSEIITYETGVVITKSGLNHRFRKIKEIASRLRENNNN